MKQVEESHSQVGGRGRWAVPEHQPGYPQCCLPRPLIYSEKALTPGLGVSVSVLITFKNLTLLLMKNNEITLPNHW